MPSALRCKQDLYKSTYEGNAFVAGKTYEVVERDERGTFLRDEEGRSFGPFVNQSDGVFYILDDYFSSPTDD